MALLKKRGLWPELVAYNCLLNWVFLTGENMLPVAFLGIIIMGECHHVDVGMIRG